MVHHASKVPVLRKKGEIEGVGHALIMRYKREAVLRELHHCQSLHPTHPTNHPQGSVIHPSQVLLQAEGSSSRLPSQVRARGRSLRLVQALEEWQYAEQGPVSR